MKCIAGALQPTKGAIALGGRDITMAAVAERARLGLSIKFQITAVLPSLTVYDNVLLALQAQDSMIALARSRSRGRLHEKVIAALDRFHLLDRVDDQAGTLSHGQQQWLEIAMALASEPKLLLLDEPTAGMSTAERRATGEFLAPLRDKCAIVIVEHDLAFLRDICDVLTVLDQGKVLETGTVAAIRASQKVQGVYLSRV
jgi:branched-chain amino acid transport system ATP-binding protein/urea transport system ATP-binding protein